MLMRCHRLACPLYVLLCVPSPSAGVVVACQAIWGMTRTWSRDAAASQS